MGETIGQWADGLSGHRVRGFVMTTRRCSNPDDVLDAVADVRRRARQALDRRQREDGERWSSVRIWAVAVPRYTKVGEWTAELTGVVDLARAPEVAVEDALAAVAPTRIRALGAPLLARDVEAHVERAISTTATIRDAGRDGIAWWYSSIDRAGGGWRAITWSRGRQAGAAR